MGWGHGRGYHHWGHHHHHHPHHHHGIGRAVAEVAEVAVVGSVAAIAAGAVANAVASRRPEPVREVIVTPQAGATPVVVYEGKGGWKGNGKGHVTEILQVPPLGVSAVGIPAMGISKQQGVTFFSVDVVPEVGPSYRVQKRYNDFDSLKERLHRMARHAWINQDFPPKHLLSCEGAKLEDRRHGLERWLTRILNDPHSRGLWCLELRSFLEVNGIHTLPPAVPVAPVAPATPEREGEVLQIVVPAGVFSGQTLSVTVPDGRQLACMIPAGVSAGCELQLWVDPVAGSVTPLV